MASSPFRPLHSCYLIGEDFLIIIYNIATSNLVLVFFTALIAVHSTYLLVYMFIIYLLAL